MDKPATCVEHLTSELVHRDALQTSFLWSRRFRAFWAHEGLAAPLTVFELGTFPSATIHPPALRDKSMLIPAPANHRLIKTG